MYPTTKYFNTIWVDFFLKRFLRKLNYRNLKNVPKSYLSYLKLLPGMMCKIDLGSTPRRRKHSSGFGFVAHSIGEVVVSGKKYEVPRCRVSYCSDNSQPRKLPNLDSSKLWELVHTHLRVERWRHKKPK